MNANVVEEIIDIVDPEKPGEWIKRKQGRRAGNVFESLYTARQIDDNERTACNDLVEIFAKSHGVMGVGERNLERVQYDAADPMTQLRIRSSYVKMLNEILARLDQHHEILLKALLKDFILGDGADARQEDGVRWRNVVRVTCSSHPYRQACVEATGGVIKCLRTYEAGPVIKAISGLPGAIEDYRKMVARNRQTA
jgi:hypothetical protein